MKKWIARKEFEKTFAPYDETGVQIWVITRVKRLPVEIIKMAVRLADLLNVSMYKCTAKDWREANPEHAKKGLNIRDFSSINELVVLSNPENLNSIMMTKCYQ